MEIGVAYLGVFSGRTSHVRSRYSEVVTSAPTAPTAQADTEVPQDFRSEYESESLSHFRKRYLWLTGVVAMVAFTIGTLQVLYQDQLPDLKRVARVSGIVAPYAGGVAVLIRFLRVYFAKKPLTRGALLTRVSRLIISFTLIQIPAAPALAALINFAIKSAGKSMNLGFGVPPLLGTLTVHFIAALIVPWTPREALRPIVPFITIYTVLSLVSLFMGDSDLVTVLLLFAITAGTVLPGIGISWWRHSRFREGFMNRAVRARYDELSAELSTARRIHDRLFPLPIRDGPLRVEFAYEPMRQIGGDILYARRDPEGAVDLVVIDVTGHGIAAALAVNRLHAELNRIYGLNPRATPAEVISALNAYVRLTMSSDRFFATALCVHADAESNTATYASAGHPPAFLYPGARGSGPRSLDSTAMMLGVLDDREFTPAPVTCAFTPGDSLYCYSDGAIESRNSRGHMLAISGFRGMLSGGTTPEDAIAAVRAFRNGPPQDDTIVVRLDRVDPATSTA
jgi:hypothetical protein